MTPEQFYRLEWLYTVQTLGWIVGGVAVVLAAIWLALALGVGGDGDA